MRNVEYSIFSEDSFDRRKLFHFLLRIFSLGRNQVGFNEHDPRKCYFSETFLSNPASKIGTTNSNRSDDTLKLSNDNMNISIPLSDSIISRFRNKNISLNM